MNKLLNLADEIESFRFCGPSDDPDEQTNVIYSFKYLVKNFVGLARRIKDREFQEDLKLINTDVDSLYEAYDLRAEVQVLIDHFHELTEHSVDWQNTSDKLVDPKIIEQLKSVKDTRFDLSKVVCFCEELNSSFNTGNYLACSLLLRSLINHIPPIFGYTTFQQVGSQVSKSRRGLFDPLDKVARGVGDLHAHDVIRHKEVLPSRFQVECFKPSLEFLLQEILVELGKSSTD